MVWQTLKRNSYCVSLICTWYNMSCLASQNYPASSHDLLIFLLHHLLENIPEMRRPVGELCDVDCLTRFRDTVKPIPPLVLSP